MDDIEHIESQSLAGVAAGGTIYVRDVAQVRDGYNFAALHALQDGLHRLHWRANMTAM